jgi:hypothetical protein
LLRNVPDGALTLFKLSEQAGAEQGDSGDTGSHNGDTGGEAAASPIPDGGGHDNAS